MYRLNLDKLVQYHRSKNDSVRQTDIALLVFGKQGQREEQEQLMLEPAFDNAFSVERSAAVWLKIDISHFTRKCLLDSKVGHELILLPDRTVDLDADPSSLALIELEEKDAKAIGVLNEGGFNGNLFRKYAPHKSTRSNVPVTEPNTRG